jgi:hypothetical protein
MSITSNLNDPNYFLAGASVTGNFNTPSQDESGIGIISAAEQNSTYVAYIEAVGNTSPEIINQTGYFVKYLIDDQGNVTTVSPNSTALYNLRNMFPEGSTAVMDSPTATSVLASLVGEHTVTDVGSIQPLLVSEYGSRAIDFVLSMSFIPYDSNQLVPSPGYIPINYSFRSDRGLANLQTLILPLALQLSPLNPTFAYDYSGGWAEYNTVNSGSFEFLSNTAAEGTYVNFSAKVGSQYNSPDALSQVYYYQLQVSEDNGNTWKCIPWKQITEVSYLSQWVEITTSIPTTVVDTSNIFAANTNFSTTSYDPQKQANILSVVCWSRTSENVVLLQNYTNYLATVITDNYTFANGTLVRLGWAPRVYNPGTMQVSCVFQGFSLNTTLVTASAAYFDSIQNVNNQDIPQWVTASQGLSNVLQNNQIQILPSASKAFNFGDIVYPANIQVGDYIRFMYNPTLMSRIYEIVNLEDSRYAFKVYPPFPSSVEKSHFCIFRMENNGKTVTLNTIKPPGGQITGVLRPKNISEEFSIKIPSILDKLKTDGLIQ